MAKPVLLMLLGRHPYAEQSGRAVMLRQRIEQARLRFDTHIIAFAKPVGDGRDEGITFWPMPGVGALAANALRLPRLPMQTWLYFSKQLRTRLRHAVEESGAAAVYVDMLRLAPLADDLPPATARIVDYDDLLSQRYAQAAGQNYEVMGFLARRVGPLAPLARLMAGPLLRFEAQRSVVYEREMLSRANLVLFTSPREAASVVSARAEVMACPPLMAARAAAGEPGRRLIFLGNLRYGENVVMLRALAEGADKLARAGALPADAIIEVVGEHAPELPGEFDPRRFHFLGRAPDLGALASAGVFLAPVVGGSGVKLKILDGMSLGCPVVGTPKACEGLAVRANRDLLVARDPTEVLRAAVALRDKTELKAMLAKRAITYLEQHHAPAMGERVADAMMDAVARKRQETL